MNRRPACESPAKSRSLPAGPRAFRILHLTCGYYLWFQFMVSFGKRIPDMPLYGLFLIPLLAVLALRLLAMTRRAEREMQAG